MLLETAIVAAGCFWGVETLFKKLNGVEKTTVGYTGGTTLNPFYEQITAGRTGHAEAIKIEFNPKKISYRELLIYFYKLHDPTTLNRQGNDKGTQYRSAIFYTNDTQKQVAQILTEELESKKVYSSPITTQIVATTIFYSAEKYHQNYLDNNPGGYMCHFIRDWKIESK